MTLSTLEQILLKYPNKSSWDFNLLTQNPNISQPFIKDHPEFPWDASVLLDNPNIEESYIENNPALPWNYQSLSLFPHLSLFFIERHIHEKWDFDMLSLHPNIDFSLVKNHPELPWNYDIFCKHGHGLSIHLYNNHPDFPWSKIYLVCNPCIRWKDVKNSDLFAYASYFSENPNITLDIIKEHPEIKWNWGRISRTILLTEEMLLEEWPWNFYWLSSNPSLTWKMVNQQRSKNWDLEYLFSNFEINEESLSFFVNNNTYLSIDWCRISFHKKIPLSILEKYKHCIIWPYIGYNEHITLAFIDAHEDLFVSYDCLSYNMFGYKEKQEKQKDLHYYQSLKSLSLQHHAIIFEELIQKTWHPSRFMTWCLDNEELEFFKENT